MTSLNMKYALALSAGLFLTAAAFAQETVQEPAHTGPWSLQDCIDYALDHNISVKQSELAIQQGEIELNNARLSRLPDLSGSVSENFSFGRGLTEDNTYDNANTTSTGLSLGTSVPVFQGFRIKHNIAMSRLNLDAATADLDKTKEDISVSVAKAYVQILYDREIFEVAKGQIVIDSLQVERLEIMAGSGRASSAEVSAQKASLAQSRLSATQALNNLNLAVLDLTQLLELPSPEGFVIEAPSTDALQPVLLMKPEDIYAEAVQTKPAIKSQLAMVDYAKSGISLAKSGWYPTLSLSGGIGTNYYTSSHYASASFADQMKNNFSQYIGINLNIPIFDRLQTKNSVRQAKLQLANSEYQLESTKKSLYKEIQQAYYNAVASQSKYESSTLAADSAKESFELMTAKYEAGKANITEFNESKNKYMEAEANLVQARYEYLFQTRLLDFYRGLPLTF